MKTGKARIRKAVITAAGWGTRFLPMTKSQPKEMLPLVDRPLIHYAVEETVASEIEDIIIVTAQGKHSIENYFDRSFELEHLLEQRGDTKLLEQVRFISSMANICYIRQREQLGLGHAVLTTKQVVGQEPFALLLPDDIFGSQVPVLKQLMEVYEEYQGSVLAVEAMRSEDLPRYGIIKAQSLEKGVYQITDLVEKPAKGEAPSNLGIVGRYILTPEVFDMLERTPPGKEGEIQLTDALKLLLEHQAVYACRYDGVRYDAGSPLGWLQATVELALRHPVLGAEFTEYLKRRR
ncbi:MAG TPA: UTP--glucose-1-phosphate uridylyltransferase GalU [Dehalococcoidia bacterium]|jgi:UTP--glucose-1-phosphate uridylyltransferase|nr:UTP--glucose-1-phosphate uridylyltransferase GalU [Dehalococcoidia bacterium]